MAEVTVPDVLAGYWTRLRARPALAGVPVHLGVRGAASEAEQVVLLRASMAGAEFFRWGGGSGGQATREPCQLAAYVFVALADDSDDSAAAALRRAGALLAECAQQLRDDPTFDGALDGVLHRDPRRWSPPLVASAQWLLAGNEEEGMATTHVRIDFSVSWTATT